MSRYHPRYSISDDPERIYMESANKTPRRRRGCRRPPILFISVWIGVTFLLSINFFILSREGQPKRSRWIGWQALQSIGSTSGPANLASLHNSNGSLVGDDLAVASASFPLDIFAPLVPNPAPLTDVTVQSCFPLSLKNCKPKSTPQEDALLGKWVLVPRALDSETARDASLKDYAVHGALDKLFGVFETRYLFYRRSVRNDVPRVVDLRLVEGGQDAPANGTEAGWHRIKHDLRTKYMRLWGGEKPLHLYVRRVDGQGKSTDSALSENWQAAGDIRAASDDAITELEITYGHDNPPWPEFYKVGAIVKGDKATGHSTTWLNARRKHQANPPIDAHPKFHADGRYKIMQIADLHLSMEEEPCRDVAWEGPSRPCHSSKDTLEMVGKWLDDEKPDLVVLTGDQLNGQGTTWDPKSVMPKVLKPIIDRKIQWAAILGNHDSETGPLTRPEIQLLLSRLPYSLSRVGPAELHGGVGAGNYYIKLESPTADRTNVFNLYFLDSGANAAHSPWQPWKWIGYDSIRRDQIDWFLKVSSNVKKILKPYQPDGGIDLPKQDWSRDPRQERPRDAQGPSSWNAHSAQGTSLGKPPAIAFVHIPVPEFFDTNAETRKFGQDRAETSGRRGAQRDRGFVDALMKQGEDRDVQLIVSGHMHNNADCQEIAKGMEKIWTCYGGGASFAGYGMKGFLRRARVFDITAFGNTVDSWSVMEDGTKLYKGLLWDHRTGSPTN
ncbi:unnamed protein product [Sympodiomycopsis kandeliae]